MVAIKKLLCLIIPTTAALRISRYKADVLTEGIINIEDTLKTFAQAIKSFHYSDGTTKIDSGFIDLAVAIETAIPEDSLPALTKDESKTIEIHVKKIKRGVKLVLAEFSHKGKLFEGEYADECKDGFRALEDISKRLSTAILSHTPHECQSNLRYELDRVSSLFGMGTLYFQRLRRSVASFQDPNEENEVDAALNDIISKAQYLENAINDLEDDGDDKQSKIDEPFKGFEDSIGRLADVENLRRLTPRESENRLALFQSVRYFINETLAALISKASSIDKDYRNDLVDRLSAILDRNTEVAAVVRFGVAYKEQKELAYELNNVNDIIQSTSDALKSTGDSSFRHGVSIEEPDEAIIGALEEVIEAILHINRATPSIRRHYSPGSDTSFLEKPFKMFERAFNKLAKCEPTTALDSLVSEVRYHTFDHIKESTIAMLVPLNQFKSFLPRDCRQRLADGISTLCDKKDRVLRVLTSGVSREYLSDMTQVVEKTFDEIKKTASALISPSPYSSRVHLFPFQKTDQKSKSGFRSALEGLMMQIELR